MNWLEIGCPYCPTVLTVPRAAAGRTVRCPECGKSYFVPGPNQTPAAYEVTTALPAIPAAAAEAESRPTSVAPLPPPAPPTNVLAAESPPTVPAASRGRRRSAYDAMTPELDLNSPLPEVEILLPPGRFSSHSSRAATLQPSAAHRTTADAGPPPSRDAYGTRTIDGGRPPLGPIPPAASGTDDGEEVKQRILRERRRVMISLAAFLIGITVMTAFAFLVVRFSRPS